MEPLKDNFLDGVFADLEHIHEIVLIVLKHVLEVVQVEIVYYLARLERNLLLLLICEPILLSTRLVVLTMFAECECISLNEQEAILRLNAEVLDTGEHEAV